jgi:hypothetical protein
MHALAGPKKEAGILEKHETEKQGTEKQPFEPSSLIEHGTVADLTEVTDGGAVFDGAAYS